MQGFVGNIEKVTLENGNFRRVVCTAKYSQLVLMTIPVGGEIGEEVHPDTDQFFRIESGVGKAVIDGSEYRVAGGVAVVVPAGAKHNVLNTGDKPLKLYTIYSPPHHRDQVVHSTKEEAEADDEHFDGKTSE